VNFALLLISTAWSAGADPAMVKPAAPPSAITSVPAAPYSGPITSGPITSSPIPSAPYVSGPISTPLPSAGPIVSNSGGSCAGGDCGGGCGGDCGPVCGCDSCAKPCLLDKLKAMLHKSKCSTCDTCGAAPACDTCAPKHSFLKHKSSCGCAEETCGSCGPVCGCESTCKPGLMDKIKAMLHKSKCSTCDTGCDTCDSCGSSGIAAPSPVISSVPSHGSAIVPGHIPGPGSVIPPATVPGTIYPSTPGTIYPSTPGTILPGTPQSKEPLKKMPKELEEKSKPTTSRDLDNKFNLPSPPVITPSSARGVETETRNPFDLDRRYEARVSRAADYSKLTGQLFFVHIDGGTWVLRFAPLWKEDANGGSVVLARDRQMESYRDGDLVTVEGSVLQQKGSNRLGGPLYQVRSIQLVERPQ
jgi:hypothetical protein